MMKITIFTASLLLFLTLAMHAKANDDIVWQHNNGQVHYWPMKSGQRQGGINIHTPVGSQWALHGVGNVGAGETPITIHNFGVGRYTTTSLTNADANRILADATTLLQTKDGEGDIACAEEMQRQGNVTSFSAGNGVVSSRAAFNQVLGQPGAIHVVNVITWCGEPGAGIIGCVHLSAAEIWL